MVRTERQCVPSTKNDSRVNVVEDRKIAEPHMALRLSATTERGMSKESRVFNITPHLYGLRMCANRLRCTHAYILAIKYISKIKAFNLENPNR